MGGEPPPRLGGVKAERLRETRERESRMEIIRTEMEPQRDIEAEPQPEPETQRGTQRRPKVRDIQGRERENIEIKEDQIKMTDWVQSYLPKPPGVTGRILLI